MGVISLGGEFSCDAGEDVFERGFGICYEFVSYENICCNRFDLEVKLRCCLRCRVDFVAGKGIAEFLDGLFCGHGLDCEAVCKALGEAEGEVLKISGIITRTCDVVSEFFEDCLERRRFVDVEIDFVFGVETELLSTGGHDLGEGKDFWFLCLVSHVDFFKNVPSLIELELHFLCGGKDFDRFSFFYCGFVECNTDS